MSGGEELLAYRPAALSRFAFVSPLSRRDSESDSCSKTAADFGCRWISQRRAVWKQHRGHGEISRIDLGDQYGGTRILLDVDLAELDPRPAQL